MKSESFSPSPLLLPESKAPAVLYVDYYYSLLTTCSTGHLSSVRNPNSSSDHSKMLNQISSLFSFTSSNCLITFKAKHLQWPTFALLQPLQHSFSFLLLFCRIIDLFLFLEPASHTHQRFSALGDPLTSLILNSVDTL